MSADDSEEHRKAPRRTGLEFRQAGERRTEDRPWPYYEKRTPKKRRSSGDRRHDADRRHEGKDGE
ncbi:MAG: hypothetical protein H7841_07715 [Magnetospirillum sp. WYHS-4]